ncbi:MAG: ketoacyl-ACP synthase III [Turicibacter sp.]|nr:ketoacyl-ACP synthase III [Turicibacter sp.]
MRIVGTGSYLPETKLSNDDLSQLVDTNDEWIATRTGIRSRHVVTDENTSDLAVGAARVAMADAGIAAATIDLLVVATSTPDVFIPGVAHQVLKGLGISQAMVFDVNAACTGFVYALDVAVSLMQAHGYRHALVIGAEVMSKIVDWNDRNTCVLFGDGAGAVVLEQAEMSGVLYRSCTAIPDRDDVLLSGGVAVNNPVYAVAQGDFFLDMKGQDVFKFAVRVVGESVHAALSETGMSVEDVDYYVLHQANRRILEYVAKKLKVPVEKFYSTIADTGNTSAASIPITLDRMKREGLLVRGMKVMLVGFGAGLTYGAMLIEW